MNKTNRNILIFIALLIALLAGSYAYGVQDEVIGILKGIALALAGITLLVVIHELGHFLAARMFGIRVETFSIGFPPKIFGIKRGDTTYQIGALPIGGYVKIVGQMSEAPEDQKLKPNSEEATEEVHADWDYRSKPVWQRVIVMSAGIVFNIVLALLIFSLIIYIFGEQKNMIAKSPGLYVLENSIGSEIGLQTGDKFVSQNGRPLVYYEDVDINDILKEDPSFVVERNGHEKLIEVPRLAVNFFADTTLRKNGVYMPALQNAIQVDSALTGPAAVAGIRTGDRIIQLNTTPIQYFQDIQMFVMEIKKDMKAKGYKNPEVDVTYLSGKDTIKAMVKLDDDALFQIRPDPAYFTDTTLHYSFFGSFVPGIKSVSSTASGQVAQLSKMAESGVKTTKLINGPLMMLAQFKNITERYGLRGFLNFAAILSVILAVMNLLPIPGLDGGHLMFLLYEGITRRKPNPFIESVTSFIGFIIVICLIILLVFKDAFDLF
ncbi:MAG: RIP metalloprotease RseP [Bacteroidia bacterium]